MFLFSPSITDGVHRNENFVEIIPVSKIQKKKMYVYIYKSHFILLFNAVAKIFIKKFKKKISPPKT